MNKSSRIRSTTILCVRRGGRLAMGGDGQVTMGENVVKQKARKIRRLFNEKVIQNPQHDDFVRAPGWPIGHGG